MALIGQGQGLVPWKNPLEPLHAQGTVTLLFSTAYLPPVSYFACLLRCDPVLMAKFGMAADNACMEQHEHYHKQTYRNRCMIASTNGPLALSVPVIFKNDQPIRDVQIDYRNDWSRQHKTSIESAYNSTPYLEYYQDDIFPVLGRQHKYLFDKNEELRETICSLLDLHPVLDYSADYLPESQDAVINDTADLRNAIHPKKPLPFNCYVPIPYPQVFDSRHGFLPELSILDLLFNMGPEALIVLKKSMPS